MTNGHLGAYAYGQYDAIRLRSGFIYGFGTADTLRGVNFVLGIVCLPLPQWPGHSLSVPIGLELYLKPEQAHQLHVPYRSRSQLARAILDFMAAQ